MNDLTDFIKEKRIAFMAKHNDQILSTEKWSDSHFRRYETGWTDAVEDFNTTITEFCVLMCNLKPDGKRFKEMFYNTVIFQLSVKGLITQIHALNADHAQEKIKLQGKVNGYMYVIQKMENMKKEL